MVEEENEENIFSWDDINENYDNLNVVQRSSQNEES